MTKEKVDLIVHNANIYTVNEEFGISEAMAIIGDEIVEVGPEHQILNKYSSEHMIDASKSFIYPGFIDAHSHFMGYATNLNRVNLIGCMSPEEMFNRVAEFDKNKDIEWIVGRGWDQTLWDEKEFPEKSWLDENLGHRNVVLRRIDGHAALVNQKVLDLAGIDANTKVEGGVIEVKDGKCTGILIDNAVDLVTELIPENNVAQKLYLAKQAEQNCIEKGLTSVCDAGVDYEDAMIYFDWYKNDKLKIKMYAMLNPNKRNTSTFLLKGAYKDENLSITSFKFYADGALGSRGANLKEEYTDDHGNKGLTLTSIDTMRSVGIKILEKGFQMNTHAIGDQAVHDVLNLYAELLKGNNDRRWRIEHSQVVDPADLHLYGDFNIIPSVQPTHATSDMDWADERLGDERMRGAYAYKSLLKQNGMLALGTDFPVEDIDPLKTLLAGMRRTDLEGEPEGGFQMEESLSFEECIRGVTIWAAIANFEEETKGSLEKGKKADFVIFNRDLKDLNADNFNNYQVLSTYINGVKVFEREKK